jgi:hypothetical protein
VTRKKKPATPAINTLYFENGGRSYVLCQTETPDPTARMHENWSLNWLAGTGETVMIGAGCPHTLTAILTDLYREEMPHFPIGRVDENGVEVNKVAVCGPCLERINRINGG